MSLFFKVSSNPGKAVVKAIRRTGKYCNAISCKRLSDYVRTATRHICSSIDSAERALDAITSLHGIEKLNKQKAKG